MQDQFDITGESTQSQEIIQWACGLLRIVEYSLVDIFTNFSSCPCKQGVKLFARAEMLLKAHLTSR